jgi:formylglycine-generating enzyme required for sulfatase activity
LGGAVPVVAGPVVTSGVGAAGEVVGVVAEGEKAAVGKSGSFWGRVALALFVVVVVVVVGVVGMAMLRLEERQRKELAESRVRAEREKRSAEEDGVKRLTEMWRRKAEEEAQLRSAEVAKAAEEMRSAAKAETKRVEELKLVEEARRAGFVWIPEGSFQMGSKEEADASVHTVSVSGFLMGETEVTYGEWMRVFVWAKANGYDFKNSGKGDSEKHPVMDVNWYDAVKWSNAKSEKEGLPPCYKVNGSVYRKGENNSVGCEWSASGYRLPTEAEWEKAARGKLSGKQYPNGEKLTKADANTDGTATKAVKSYEPNGYGLYDMSGNVLEWCWDWYAKAYAGTKDPRGPDSSSDRVLRGATGAATRSTRGARTATTSPPRQRTSATASAWSEGVRSPARRTGQELEAE